MHQSMYLNKWTFRDSQYVMSHRESSTWSFHSKLADEDSMGHVIKQTHGQAFQTLGKDFDFLLDLKKLVFWNEPLVESFDQRTHSEDLKIWPVKSSPHTSNKSQELVEEL